MPWHKQAERLNGLESFEWTLLSSFGPSKSAVKPPSIVFDDRWQLLTSGKLSGDLRRAAKASNNSHIGAVIVA